MPVNVLGVDILEDIQCIGDFGNQVMGRRSEPCAEPAEV